MQMTTGPIAHLIEHLAFAPSKMASWILAKDGVVAAIYAKRLTIYALMLLPKRALLLFLTRRCAISEAFSYMRALS